MHQDGGEAAPPPEEEPVPAPGEGPRPTVPAEPARPLLILPQREALVAITATATAMVRCSTALLLLVRRLIVAHYLEGYVLEFGYRLKVYPVRQGGSHTLRQRHWQEQTMAELLRSQGTVTLDPAVLARIRATFGTTSHTLRFVCGTEPGPRVPRRDGMSSRPCIRGPHRCRIAPAASNGPAP